MKSFIKNCVKKKRKRDKFVQAHGAGGEDGGRDRLHRLQDRHGDHHHQPDYPHHHQNDYQVLIKLETMEKTKTKKKADLNKMFDIFGSDGDGRPKMLTLKNSSSAFDADGDGVISKEEFNQGMN